MTDVDNRRARNLTIASTVGTEMRPCDIGGSFRSLKSSMTGTPEASSSNPDWPMMGV
jgi:hypothetical protein